MDLSRVTFPTFVLEPRSMLERITDFMAFPDLLFGAEKCNDPEERFVRVLQYYLAGWHIKPKGVKKPYEALLVQRSHLTRQCVQTAHRGSTLLSKASPHPPLHLARTTFPAPPYPTPASYTILIFSPAVSHHPPVSAFFYTSPENHVAIVGELRPKSKFLGNSVSTTMEGENRVSLLGRPEDGEYVVTMPNMYARGILFGKMVLELGDTCMAKNEKNNLYCDLDFKTKGFFSGTYNAIAGRVRHNSCEIGEITGRWSHTMEIKNTKTGQKRVLFDVAKDGQNVCPKWVPPEAQQEHNESRRLWHNLTQAIVAKDMEKATDAKMAVEEAQREQRKKMEELGTKHVQTFFEERNGRWMPKIDLPRDPKMATQLVQDWIFPSKSSSTNVTAV
ncbi:hypothetical protein NP233_g11987 [Leucocoprinus birnbaumii]|uniref:Oxysterol-binding protein n=1 Tax=Leucocoprinus birnbaumii TaxID=56174 RepID=A0AAD5VFX7_9AGAR|nr:hypothetical protein NP233_g11987 [Leucocoprinus birnbaumii]